MARSNKIAPIAPAPIAPAPIAKGKGLKARTSSDVQPVPALLKTALTAFLAKVDNALSKLGEQYGIGAEIVPVTLEKVQYKDMTDTARIAKAKAELAPADLAGLVAGWEKLTGSALATVLNNAGVSKKEKVTAPPAVFSLSVSNETVNPFGVDCYSDKAGLIGPAVKSVFSNHTDDRFIAKNVNSEIAYSVFVIRKELTAIGHLLAGTSPRPETKGKDGTETKKAVVAKAAKLATENETLAKSDAEKAQTIKAFGLYAMALAGGTVDANELAEAKSLLIGAGLIPA